MAFFGNLFGHRAQKPTAMPTFSPSAKGPFVFPGLDENLQPIRSEAVKIEPKLPDYASYSDEQLARCFLPENWTAKSCDNDHRQALLQEASNRFAAAHGLPPTRVRLNSNLAEADMGAYSPSSRSIELNPNPKYLDNPFEALDSVVHETQHYVDDMNVRRGTGDTPENLAVYACEQSSAGYGDPPDSKAERNAAWQDAYNYYQMQSLEAHANNAGFAAVASHHELFKNCPEYSDYLARRDRYFSNLKDNLAADPEKWKGMEQDHIQKANGQTQATRELAAGEVKRGTDAQQKAALNADSVKLLQHDCARQKQQATARNSATVQNGADTPKEQNTIAKTAPPPSDERSRHEAFVASLRQGLGQNNGQNPGQKAGQNSGQGAAASDGAPDPPERERTRPEQGRPRDEDDDRMRRTAPLDEDTRDTGRSEEQAPRTEKTAPRPGEAQPGQSPEIQGQTPAPEKTAPQGEAQPGQAPEPQGQTPAPEENAPQQGEARPGQSPETQGQTPAPEENAPDNGEETNPGKQQTVDGETNDGRQQNTTAETQTAPVGESGEAAVQAHATEPEEEADAPAPAQEAAVPAPEEESAQAPAAGESPREGEDRPEAGEQAPHTEDDAPDRGEPTGPDREEPEPTPAETDGIGEGPDRDDHGPNNGPQQDTDEEAEGIREPEAAREAAPAEAQDGIQDSPESETPHGEEQRDGIQDTPDLSRENAPEADEGIQDRPQARENTPEDDGIRDSGEETAPDPSREEQAEGISGPDTAPAESAGEEQSLGQ